MKDEAAAYHEAGQAVMAFYPGVNEEIDERRYCGLCFPFGHNAEGGFIIDDQVAAAMRAGGNVGPSGPPFPGSAEDKRPQEVRPEAVSGD